MAGDFMIGEDLDEYVISPMSLALMEDSGWYQVNYFHAGLLRFGKNQGCGFVDGKCITNEKSTFSNEYLVNQLNSLCFAGRSAKGGSSLIIVEEDKENQVDPPYQYFLNKREGGNYLADFCPIVRSYDNNLYYMSGSCSFGNPNFYPFKFGETIGEDSSCFMSTLMKNNDNSDDDKHLKERSICQSVICNSDLTYSVKIGSAPFTCPSAGGRIKVKGFNGNFNCVDYNLICTKSTACANVFDCISRKVTGLTLSYNYVVKDKTPSIENNNYLS